MNLMSDTAPTGWYKAKLHDYRVMQWVVVYYNSDRKEFYFGLNRLTPDRVKEVKEFIMGVDGELHNMFAHR
jgi:hypothetical protein